jgi:microcystin-dependent protein
MDFSKTYSNTNNAFVVKKSNEVVEVRELSSRISVYGIDINVDLNKLSWNITTNLDTGLTEAINTTYYCYLSENGKPIISDYKPYERLDLNGFYHPYESWRCIAKFYNNASSEITNVRQIGKPIDNFVGVIFEYAGNVTPDDCLRCDGSSLKRADFPELFNAIGTSWGYVDADHFNIPDTRGVAIRGWANGSGRDPDRAGRAAITTGGATGDNVGSYQADTYGYHGHSIKNSNGPLVGGGGSNGYVMGTGTVGYYNSIVGDSGGNETRMKNVYVNLVIKYR